ncbi:EAL domain-containing protein [Cohaesibacter sp. CAU 1516]|nr:EAL domain-containing protein [Cohaesibacter sp. CAU 1516]
MGRFMPIEHPQGERDIVTLSDVMAVSAPIWVFDIDRCRIIWANDAARRLWQAESLEALYQRDVSKDLGPQLVDRLSGYQKIFATESNTFKELWTLYPDDEEQRYEVQLRRHTLSDHRVGALCTAREVPARSTDRLHSVKALNNIPVCITLFSMNGEPIYANKHAHDVYGDDQLSLKARFLDKADYAHLLEALEHDNKATAICEVSVQDGIRWHEISARNCNDAQTGEASYILSEVDVTGLKEQERRISFMAHHDMLTGLHSRNYVNNEFPGILSKRIRENKPMAMLLIDLDNFKTINDTMGHMAGDQLLVHIALILDRLVGARASIGRLGGDEFIVLLPFETKTELETVCVDLLKELSSECMIGGHMVHSRASIGISICPEHGSDVSTLMRHADLALYEAKDAGRDTYRYFRQDLQQAAILKQTLEKDLTRAMSEGEFRLYYQPRVDCLKQTILGAEALMRWYHPEQGVVPPGMFIEALEETGMIHQVGDWIVTQAGRDQRRMAAEGFDLPISINISPKQFERPDFVSRLKSNLAKTQCPPSRIEIEITESMLVGEGFDAKQTLLDLRRAGFSIAVDDFGTGYSNLAYIHQYPISVLKVDRSFIQMIEDQTSVVNMILSLCRLVGITAVAEGVETMDQLEWLQLNHCNQYQGYLFSKPQPLDAFLKILQDPPKFIQLAVAGENGDLEISWA